jgi:hypothetical protein
MTAIFGLISMVLGAAQGMAPAFFDEWKAGREHKRETERLDHMHKLQLETARLAHDSKMREIEVQADIADNKAWSDRTTAMIEAQARPTGIVWVDAFNALLRPTCATIIMALFTVIASWYAWSVIGQFGAGAITADQAVKLLWGSLIGEVTIAMLGYVFGYRGGSKLKGS